MARLYLLQILVVVNVLRPVVKIDEYLGIAVRQEAVDRVCMDNPLEIDEQLDKLTKREFWKMSLVDHYLLIDLFDPLNSFLMTSALEIGRKPCPNYPVHFLGRIKARGK